MTYTVNECVRIICHAEYRIGHEITYDEVSQGALTQLLIPKDYASITQVCLCFHIYL